MLRIRPINSTSRLQSGLTIVELAIVVVIVGLLFPIFSMLIVSSYRDTVYMDDKVKMAEEVKQAMWYMDDNIRTSSGFLATVPVPFTDPYVSSSGGSSWSYKGSSADSRVLITKSYATTVNSLNNGRQPVFMNTPEFNCTTQMYYQPQLVFLTIYYVSDDTLYRRVLTDTTSALCAGNAQSQRQTCPPSVDIGSRHASCGASDEVLATRITDFSVTYYQISQDGLSTAIDPNFVSNDPEILVSADYADVTITTSSRNGAVTNTITQRMTKVNQ